MVYVCVCVRVCVCAFVPVCLRACVPEYVSMYMCSYEMPM